MRDGSIPASGIVDEAVERTASDTRELRRGALWIEFYSSLFCTFYNRDANLKGYIVRNVGLEDMNILKS